MAGYAGSIFGGITSIHDARNTSQDATYNAALERQQGAVTRQQGAAAEDAQRRQSRKELGAQRAAQAESGTGFGGTNLTIARESAVNAELDALNIRYNADISARGNEVKAQQYDRVAKRNMKIWDTFQPFGQVTKILSGPGAWVGEGLGHETRGFLQDKGGY